jgi:ABC-type transport system substrate-binding protein
MSRPKPRWSERLVPAVALVAVMALAATGCGSSTSNPTSDGAAASASDDVVVAATGPPQAGGKLTYGLDAETDGWDPTSSRWSAAGLTVANAVFDPLAAWDADFHTQPYLAQSIDHNDTYDQWTITMRSGTTFHDGTPVNAAAVKTFIDGIRESVLTKPSFAPISATTVVDDLTLQVTMSIPWSAFMASLTAQSGMVAAPSQLADKANGSRNPVGSGPFVFDKWTPDSLLTVKKNQHYWRPGLPYVDAIDFRPIPEPQSIYDALRSGDINMFATNNSILMVKLTADAKAGDLQQVKSRGEVEESSIMLNTAKPPLDDVRLRTALAYATDTKGLTQISKVDPGDVARGPFVDGTHWAVDTDYPTFDLDKAKELVAQVAAEKGPVAVALQCTDSNEIVQICQAIAAQWEAAGVAVTISSTDQGSLINNAIGGSYEASIWRQFGNPDPDGDALWWNGANAGADGGIALNMARNQDPVLDAALSVGRSSHDDTERKLAYITVQEQMAKDVPYVWLSHVTWALAAQNTMRGIQGTTLPDGTQGANLIGGIMRLTEVWFQN